MGERLRIMEIDLLAKISNQIRGIGHKGNEPAIRADRR